MTGTESTPDNSSPYSREQFMAIEAMQLVQDILMDEDIDTERGDIWTATWDQVKSPADQYLDSSEESHRQTAYNQIHTLYTDALETLYPQLKSVHSVEEMLVEMAMIPDLPECRGTFTFSQYEAENGNVRVLSYTEVQLGDRTTMSACVTDAGPELVKYYGVTIGVDQTMWGGSEMDMNLGVTKETEVLDKVHPSQSSNLLRVLYGVMVPYEMELKLTEIRIASEDLMSESELDTIIEYARNEYYKALSRKADEAAAGIGMISSEDLNEVHDIIMERIQQIDRM